MDPTFKECPKDWWNFEVKGMEIFQLSQNFNEVKRRVIKWNK